MKWRRRAVFTKLSAVVAGFMLSVFLLSYGMDESTGSTWLNYHPENVKHGMIRKWGAPEKNVSQISHGELLEEKRMTLKSSAKPRPISVLKKGVVGNYEPAPRKTLDKPGEDGKPVFTKMEEKTLADQSVRNYGYNMVASEKIAMDRKIPDTRMNECKFWHYPKESDLPSASVIIVFHNEGFSPLMRTVHSVINMSPPALLKEVIMVDDKSTKENLKTYLEKYLRNNFNDKVKLFRNSKREGLIRTRTLGAKYASGDAIVFLDAHCECNQNWLVPLLARIAYDRTILAVPIIDLINWDDFSYRTVYANTHFRGIFEWGFLYKETKVPERELKRRKYNSEPYRSPTHAGGLFAMDRKYFFALGGYDPGLQIWGGENFELSFKIWQCGGSIEWVPCSHVGHIYRANMPSGFIEMDSTTLLLNYVRVIEVWLDKEYRKYFYTRQPFIEGCPLTNISKLLEFKKEHNCKSFKWFLDNVAYEILDKYPPLPVNKYWGEIILENTTNCIDTHRSNIKGGTIGISHCYHTGENQVFRLNVKGQLSWGEYCIGTSGDTLYVQLCPVQPIGNWLYQEDTKQILNRHYQKCVEVGSNAKLHLKDCIANSKMQQWHFKKIWSWRK